MATIAYPGNLATAQAGTGDSTNVIQLTKGGEINLRALVLRVTTNAGTTITFTIQGAPQLAGPYQNLYYSVMSAVAGDWTNAAITTTTAKTELYQILPGQGMLFIKTVVSANTGMTPTTDLL